MKSHDSECYHYAVLTILIDIGSFSNAQFFIKDSNQLQMRKYMTHNIGLIWQFLEVLIMTSNDLYHHL